MLSEKDNEFIAKSLQKKLTGKFDLFYALLINLSRWKYVKNYEVGPAGTDMWFSKFKTTIGKL